MFYLGFFLTHILYVLSWQDLRSSWCPIKETEIWALCIYLTDGLIWKCRLIKSFNTVCRCFPRYTVHYYMPQTSTIKFPVVHLYFSSTCKYLHPSLWWKSRRDRQIYLQWPLGLGCCWSYVLVHYPSQSKHVGSIMSNIYCIYS